MSGKSQKEKKDVTSAGAKISVVFEPAAELTSRLNDEREFRFVEVPTAEGQQDAEGDDTPTPSPSPASDTLAAPTISGNTTFSESTEVSIAAAAGAEIRYTTDGSTPTASSTLYSAAITLTETTSVKAIAIKDGQTSEVASKTFVKSKQR